MAIRPIGPARPAGLTVSTNTFPQDGGGVPQAPGTIRPIGPSFPRRWPRPAVGPYRNAFERKTPIHNTWFPPFRQGQFRTFGPNLTPPAPTGVLDTNTGTRNVKVAQPPRVAFPAARPNAAAVAPRRR